jgi:site-specific recombinase XerD
MKIYKLTLKFFLKEPETEKMQSIYCRLILNRAKAEFSTGQRCTPREWDALKEECKQKQHKSNAFLVQIKNEINAIQYKYQNTGRSLTVKKVKQLLQGKEKAIYTMLEFSKYYVNKRLNNEGPKVIIKQTEVAIRYLEEFLIKENNKNILIEDFTQGHLTDFFSFMKNTKYGVHGKNFKLNTVHKYISKIRSILNYATQHDIINKNPCVGFTINKSKVKTIGLDYSQIKSLIDLELKDKPELEITRDCFIFSCLTGIRFSDAKQISPDNLFYNKKSNIYYLKFVPQKTLYCNEDELSIPLANTAVRIIEKYRSHPLTNSKNKLLPMVSNQKSNKKLKKLQEIIKMDELTLTYHKARHSFSNAYFNLFEDNNNMLKREDPVKDSLMGHSNNSMSALYSQNIKLSTKFAYIEAIENKILNS